MQAAGTEGLFKVPTLRNVAQTAPYAHNGFFPTLYSIVHFYNTRIDKPLGGHEVGAPNEEELGALGLSKAQEEKIVLFMETLTDR
jgi:cytochrome c peroxidase